MLEGVDVPGPKGVDPAPPVFDPVAVDPVAVDPGAVESAAPNSEEWLALMCLTHASFQSVKKMHNLQL